MMKQIRELDGAKIIILSKKDSAEKDRKIRGFSLIDRMVIFKRCYGRTDGQTDESLLYRFADPRLFSLGNMKRLQGNFLF